MLISRPDPTTKYGERNWMWAANIERIKRSIFLRSLLARALAQLPESRRQSLALEIGGISEVSAALKTIEAADKNLAVRLKQYTDIFRYDELLSLLAGEATT